jgi:Xaa-Pro aminopeptidase
MHSEADWQQGIDWDALRNHRMSRLLDELASSELDGLLMTKLDSIRYAIAFRGVTSIWFHGTRYVLIVAQDGSYRFLVASGDFERVSSTMPWLPSEVFTALPLEIGSGVDLVVEAIQTLGLAHSQVGVDLAPYRLFEPLLERLPDVRFRDGQGILDHARSLKHPEEVKLLRRAAEVADAGMETALALLRPGAREDEIAIAVTERMLTEGAEEVTHRPLVESGPNAWLGYRFPTDRRMKNGDMVYIDSGSALINGYLGDIARVSVVGSPSEEQADLYQHMVEMLRVGTESLRPGAAASSVAEAVKGVVRGTPYEHHTYFGIIGHGIGTDMHEPPVIGDRVASDHADNDVLRENMVVCLEPGILVPGVGGGHVENMVLIGKDGPEPLTKTALDAALLDGAGDRERAR